MNVLNEIWELWKNAETPEVAAAYCTCYFIVKEWIQGE